MSYTNSFSSYHQPSRSSPLVSTQRQRTTYSSPYTSRITSTSPRSSPRASYSTPQRTATYSSPSQRVSSTTTFPDETNTFIQHFQEREQSYDRINEKIRHNESVKPYELPRIGKSPYLERYGIEDVQTSPRTLFPSAEKDLSFRASPSAPRRDFSRVEGTNNTQNSSFRSAAGVSGGVTQQQNPQRESLFTASQSPREGARTEASQETPQRESEHKSPPAKDSPPSPARNVESPASGTPQSSKSTPPKIISPPQQESHSSAEKLKVPQSPSNAEYNAEKYNDSIEDLKQTTEWIQQTLMSNEGEINVVAEEEISIIEAHGTTDSEDDQDEDGDAVTSNSGSPPKEQHSSPARSPPQHQTSSASQERISSSSRPSSSPAQRYSSNLTGASRSNISTYTQDASHNYSSLNNTTNTQRKGPCLIPGYETPYNIDRHTTKCSAAIMSTHLFLTGDKQRVSSSYPSRLDFFKHGYQTFWNRETTPQERRLICRWMRGENIDHLGKDAAWQFYQMIQRAPRAESSFMVYQVIDAPPISYKIEEVISQGLFSASWHPDSVARALQGGSTDGKILLCVEIPQGEPFLWLTNDLLLQASDKPAGSDFVDKRRQLLFWIGRHQLSVTKVQPDCLCAFMGIDRETEFRVTLPVAFARLR